MYNDGKGGLPLLLLAYIDLFILKNDILTK
jgi:hypothetical protein